jgi:hypothetical protein
MTLDAERFGVSYPVVSHHPWVLDETRDCAMDRAPIK